MNIKLKLVTLIKLLKYQMTVLLIAIYFYEIGGHIASASLSFKGCRTNTFFNLLIQTHFLFGFCAKASKMPILRIIYRNI